MRRPVSGRDAVRSQVIDVLKAQIRRRPAMKKISTVVTKQSRNISQLRLTIGLDLGDRNSCYCVLDETGRIQGEQRVRTNAKALQEVFSAMPRSRVALEIGTHSPWISRLLSELGHEVVVANARKVRLIGESRKKDDRLDAQTVARLGRAQYEPGKSRRTQSRVTGGTAAVAGGTGIAERANRGVQRTDRASGAGELSAGGTTETDQGGGHADRADLH